MKYLSDYPELLAQWHPTKNGDIDPKTITHGSHKKCWFKCPVAKDHEWESPIDSLIRNYERSKNNSNGCPCCRGLKVVLSNCLATTYPEVAKLWHPIKNGNITPYDVAARSGKKYWFKCPIANDHEWETSICNITRESNSNGCPCCHGLKVVLSNCLATTYPEIAKEWHPTKNGTLTPYDITAGCDKKVWWKCPIANDHEWEATIASRMHGNGCPCCRGLKVVLSNCLATTYPEIAKEWHPTKNGNITPHDVTGGSNKKYWFKCLTNENHEWKTSVCHRTDGKGCPFCNESKGEKRILEYLDKLSLPFDRQYTHEKCRHKKLLPFDFIVRIGKRKGFLIEYQGEQHYEPVSFGSKKRCPKQMLSDIQKRDKIKKEFCEKNNIPLLIIPYWNFDKIEEMIDEFILKQKKVA